jgi:DNA gyrase/topoisomerase IV subunit B
MYVYSDKRPSLRISSIEKIEYKHDYIYDLTVEDYHTYCCGYDSLHLENCDGGHIIVLVILAIWKFAPQLVRDGKLKIILPPLYGTHINKQFVPIYDDVELAKYRSQGLDIHRFKGLGEMDSEELEVVVRAGDHEYQIEAPKDRKSEDAILSCITNTDLKRQLCNDIDRFNLQKIFDAI